MNYKRKRACDGRVFHFLKGRRGSAIMESKYERERRICCRDEGNRKKIKAISCELSAVSYKLLAISCELKAEAYDFH